MTCMEDLDTKTLKIQILDSARNLQPEIVNMRRKLHQFPETMFEEFQTSQFIQEYLTLLGYEVIGTAGTGWIASLKGTQPGMTIALRADMDALNIHEENLTPYRSKNEGKMHACGHDAHMACLLGAAKLFMKYRQYLCGTIKLVFQPGEEGGGGGKKIIEEGHFKGVDKVFGIHVWSPLSSGVIGSNLGPMMAASDMFEIEVEGKGGHAAFPYLSIDPTLVIQEIYTALQKLITREINPLHTVLITTPQMKGSDAANVIPSKAKLRGTLRSFNSQDRDYIIDRMRELINNYSQAWRCKGKFRFLGTSYPALINHHETYRHVEHILQELGGVQTIEPCLGGEDFAFYLEKTEGVFVFLGIRNEEKGIIYPHHHPKFEIDEEILWKGCAIYALLGFYNIFMHS